MIGSGLQGLLYNPLIAFSLNYSLLTSRDSKEFCSSSKQQYGQIEKLKF